MKLIRLLLMHSVLISLVFSVSYADTVRGSLEFIKKPPKTGIVFLVHAVTDSMVAEMDQKNKKFTKKIITVTPNSKIHFKNSDNVEHNIFAQDRILNIRFDVGLMLTGGSVEMPVTWSENTLIRIGCKIHPKMLSYIANIQSEKYHTFNFDKTVKKYIFSIADVPMDVTEFILLLPKYNELKLNIKNGEAKKADIIKKDKVRGFISLSRE